MTAVGNDLIVGVEMARIEQAAIAAYGVGGRTKSRLPFLISPALTESRNVGRSGGRLLRHVVSGSRRHTSARWRDR